MLITINGIDIEAEKGATIYEIAKSAGIYIPTLCHHPDLPTFGGCRVCMVEANGRLVTACRAPGEDGMIVHTDTEKVREVRLCNVELILANHDKDCQTCEKNSNCTLQEVSNFVGITSERMNRLRRFSPDKSLDYSNPFFSRDFNKCILCGICIRACDEISGVEAIEFAFRGYKTTVAVLGDKPLLDSKCESCGECVERCPTGALSYVNQFAAEREVETICSYCGVGCGISLGIRGEQVVSVRGNKQNPVNQGELCVKGRFGFHFINHPDRLKTPLVKRNGKFEEVSWDEALNLAADKFNEIKNTHGIESLGGIGSARCTNEENYLFQKLFRLMRCSNIDHCARLCHSPSVAGLSTVFGSGAMTNSIDDIENAKGFFVMGSNTTENHPVIAYRIKRTVKRKGAFLIVADPRRISLAEKADIFLQLRPGTDAALLIGIAKVIVDENLYSKDFIEERCEGFEEYIESLRSVRLEEMASITGVPAEEIARAARMYATNKPSSIFYAMGITQHSHGTNNVLALANLAMLTGNIGKKGGGVNPLRGQNNVQGACDMGVLPNVFPGYQPVNCQESRKKFEKAYGVKLSEKEGLAMPEMFKAALEGDLKALYIVGENPVMSEPASNKTREALDKLKLLVVQDIFLTETASFADIVLPAASFAEKNGTFVNTERRIQRVKKAINPPGEAKDDIEIISALAKKMGITGFEYSGPEDIIKEIASLVPTWRGISYDRLGISGMFWPCVSDQDSGTPILYTDKFLKENGKAKFKPVKYSPPQENPDKEYPFILTTGRVLYHYHTSTMTGKSKGLIALHDKEKVLISLKDAEQLGITKNDKVRIASRRGEVIAEAFPVDIMQEGTIFMTFHFAKACANELTNTELDPVSKIPELKVCAVKVERL